MQSIDIRSRRLGQEKKNILRHYLFGDKIIQNCAYKFRRQFNFSNYPQKSQIYRWVHKFQATASVNNLNKMVENPRSDWKLTAKCPDNVDAVRDSVGRNPKKSFRRRSQELGFSYALLCLSISNVGMLLQMLFLLSSNRLKKNFKYR